MPRNAPRLKMESTAALGAEIVTVGPASTERLQKAEELAQKHGYVIVPPYNDEQIIAGQGTVGLEILEDCPEVDLVLVPSRRRRPDQRRLGGHQAEWLESQGDRR